MELHYNMLNVFYSLHQNHQDGKEGGQMTLQKRKRKGKWLNNNDNTDNNNWGVASWVTEEIWMNNSLDAMY